MTDLNKYLKYLVFLEYLIQEMNIWKLDNQEDILSWFKFLSKDIRRNNNGFFHYSDQQLTKYCSEPRKELRKRFNNFRIYWQHFNKKKRQIQHFIQTHNLPEYPEEFDENERIIVDTIQINYQDILKEINSLLANKQKIPYEYKHLINKLVKTIIYQKILNNKPVHVLTIDIEKNQIYTQFYTKNTKYIKTFKLQKFILKYQKIYPQYKFCEAWLVVSKNWQDILLQSTFKQWTSCMNLVNTYSDPLIDNSCVNSIKNGNLIAYLVLNLHDEYTIDDILDNNKYDGLCYNRCIWRCNILRYNCNYEYVYCAENTSYGTILHNAIAYHTGLFKILNEFVSKINKNLIQEFQPNQIAKLYKNEHLIFSDIFYLKELPYVIKYYNIKLYKEKIKTLSKSEKLELQQELEKQIELLTGDILAFLNVFHHFSENQQAIEYINTANTHLSNKQYINYKYFQEKHFFIKNTFDLYQILMQENF